ncbi:MULTISPECIES: substrate-binding domain-containing protein [Aerococcus]|uniref:substrate-binding domain-containing protein n=1 Tax=Aerococcus urinae (strain CCUG 59500 / ACS-120-V-Col10a) TaxID=2976812 RepID=UPI000200F3B9|nr:substrate-binding domain-containing protein [Aerococcus sp. Group 1]AEA01149.1 putative catabolite control protein A [Aerococcus sp. Group 1]MCY3031650.1 substrate-binding domain-containing protein [Aerococcus sp. Group 1]MCY3055768.1 substrate-binding domain-containing protein [Aerococcus sp. Group 1]MCY3057499.1 substrate-binding domain-containing protein [Aerococcus sp. Group 1]MCY3062778.1 substrate-binding domain-containing protein [Aerococcus sp. Group 1]
MEKQNVTIYDVAHQAGVSMATVSRVVNGNPNVRPKTREKVMKVIKELNYHPNVIARGLASKRTRYIGVLLPDITNPYYSSLALGIDDIANMYEYNIILANADPEHDAAGVESLIMKQVDGIIFIGNSISQEARQKIFAAGRPCVFTDLVDPEATMPTINIDVEDAYYQVTKDFLAKGKKRIALVGSDQGFKVSQSRQLQGYEKALTEAGHAVNEDLLIAAKSPSYDSGYALYETFSEIEADAAIATDDTIAIGLLNALLDNGVKIPEEVEIMASDNSSIVNMSRPELSSIAPPIYDIGAVAMRALTKLMENETLDTDLKLPYQIIKGGTTS